jgi:hypothetical protein
MTLTADCPGAWKPCWCSDARYDPVPKEKARVMDEAMNWLCNNEVNLVMPDVDVSECSLLFQACLCRQPLTVSKRSRGTEETMSWLVKKTTTHLDDVDVMADCPSFS